MKRLGKILLHLWHPNGHLGRRDFIYELLRCSLFVVVVNSLLIFLYYQSKNPDWSHFSEYLLWLIFLANFASAIFFCRIAGKRINDVRGDTSSFSGGLYILAMLFPYSGLYMLLFLCARRGRVTEHHAPSPKEWTLLRHTLIALSFPLLLLAPVRYYLSGQSILEVKVPTSLNLLHAAFYDNAEPGLRYILRTMRSASVVPGVMEKCLAKSNECMTSLAKDRDTTLVLLQIILNNTQVINNHKTHHYSQADGQNKLLAVVDMLKRNLKIIQSLDYREDQFNLAIPYGVYLFSGVIQVPLLEIIDHSLERSLLSRALPLLQKIVNSTNAKLEEDQSLLEEQKRQMKQELEILSEELREQFLRHRDLFEYE